MIETHMIAKAVFGLILLVSLALVYLLIVVSSFLETMEISIKRDKDWKEIKKLKEKK